MSEVRPITTATRGHERRAHIRVDVLGQVEAHSVWKLQPVTLREISAGGFSLDATTAFEPGTLHKFRLSTDTSDGQGRSLVVQARASHSSLASVTGGLAVYLVGFQLIGMTDHAVRELTAMIAYAERLWANE